VAAGMLVVVVLLPLSSPMNDGEFDHGGGGGGCGSPAAAAVVVVAAAAAAAAVGDNLSAKAAGNQSIDGRMMACDGEIGWRTTTQQPTKKQRRGGSTQRDGDVSQYSVRYEYLLWAHPAKARR